VTGQECMHNHSMHSDQIKREWSPAHCSTASVSSTPSTPLHPAHLVSLAALHEWVWLCQACRPHIIHARSQRTCVRLGCSTPHHTHRSAARVC
jgi:hypothetical protein